MSMCGFVILEVFVFVFLQDGEGVFVEDDGKAVVGLLGGDGHGALVNVGFADFDYVAFITVYKTKILPPKGRQEIFLSPRPSNGQGLRMAFACIVIPARLERATHSLEGCCSIQLSYGTNP